MLITPIMFSMVADTADYGELQTGKKLTAVTFSGHLLAIKLGFAIGGASAGWILSGFNYVPNQVQTQESLTGIITAFAIMPIICTVITLILAKRYRLTEPAVIDIQKQLMART